MKMQYGYSGYITDVDERIEFIANDILREYPNIGMVRALQAARLEPASFRCHEDYDQFDFQKREIFRLINIINVTRIDPNLRPEFDRALADIRRAFASWNRAFTYANPEEQTEYIIMQKLQTYLNDNRELFPTVEMVEAEIRRKRLLEEQERQRIIDSTMQYGYTGYIKDPDERAIFIAKDILREYPNLGLEIALEAAYLEPPSFRCHEDYDQFDYEKREIFRLINIINVTRNNPALKAEFDKAVSDIREAFRNWKRNFTYANPKEQTEYMIMEQLEIYLNDNSQEFPTVESVENRRRNGLR